MSALRADSACRRFDRWLTAYVDDELDAVHCLELEDHLTGCSGCAETVAMLMATRASLRACVPAEAPSSLRARVQATLREELALEEGPELEEHAPASEHPPTSEDGVGGSVRPVESPAPRLVKLRHIVPFAAAATFALVFGAMQLQKQEATQVSSADSAEVPVQRASLDGLLDDLVAQHAHPPPPETTDPDGLRRFDPYLGIRVRQPAFDGYEARYVGARMHQRAALLQYILRDSQRVTMYVFDTKRVPLEAGRIQLERGPGKTYVGRIRGYSVAASEREGVGYALASDLSPEESAALLLRASQPR